MSGETPVFARMTKAAASDVEPADLSRDRRTDENADEPSQDRQSSSIKDPENKGDSTKNFQPGQIKCEPDANRPRENFVVIDVVGKTNRIQHFENSSINENSADNEVCNAPDGLWHN